MTGSSLKSDCSDNKVIVPVLPKIYTQDIKLRNHHKPRRKKFCFVCRSQSNSLILILSAYVTIFSIASVILILSVLKLQNISDNDRFIYNGNISNSLYLSKYKSLIKHFDNISYQRYFKDFIWPYKQSNFNCSNLNTIKKFNYLTSGWTKNVFSFELNGNKYALKTVNIDGTHMSNCTQKLSLKVCVEKASIKMYKEYILSRELTHSNIVKVLAWCVNSSNFSYDVSIISELCLPIDIILLLRMSFYQRLKIMLDLSQLMVYLSNSFLGSVAINDFQRQQFVLCGDNLKLTDLDDLSIEEPKCNEISKCSLTKLFQYSKENENFSSLLNLNCIDGYCLGYNEKQNVINTYKHFVNLFLNITTPVELTKDVENLFNTYISTWSAKEVYKNTELLFKKFSNLRNRTKV